MPALGNLLINQQLGGGVILMNDNRRVRLFSAVGIGCLLVLTLSAALADNRVTGNQPTASATMLEQMPSYSEYRFSRDSEILIPIDGEMLAGDALPHGTRIFVGAPVSNSITPVNPALMPVACDDKKESLAAGRSVDMGVEQKAGDGKESLMCPNCASMMQFCNRWIPHEAWHCNDHLYPPHAAGSSARESNWTPIPWKPCYRVTVMIRTHVVCNRYCSPCLGPYICRTLGAGTIPGRDIDFYDIPGSDSQFYAESPCGIGTGCNYSEGTPCQ